MVKSRPRLTTQFHLYRWKHRTYVKYVYDLAGSPWGMNVQKNAPINCALYENATGEKKVIAINTYTSKAAVYKIHDIERKLNHAGLASKANNLKCLKIFNEIISVNETKNKL